MHLYIFNSKQSFIKKSIFVAIVLLTAYLLFVTILPIEKRGANQNQGNIVKAQKYFCSEKKYDTIMVGSSMGANIVFDDTNQNIYNLSFGGGSAFTGLELIKYKAILPKNLLVEVTQALVRESDDNIVRKTVNPLIKIFPFMLEENRPDAMIFSLLRSLTKKEDKLLTDPEIPSKTALRVQQTSHNDELDKILLEKRIKSLKNILVQFEEQGVNVILFETPLHYTLYDTIRYKQVKQMLLVEFPKENYIWIEPDFNLYKTTDGIHLGAASGKKFGEEIISQICLLKK